MDRREFLLALALAPSVLAHEPLAYVTADTESHVVVVGMTTGKVYRRIPTAPSPFSIERVGSHALVAHTVTGRVTVLELHEIEGFGEPRYAAAARDGRHAFISDSGHTELVTVDVVRGAIVGRVKLSQWPRGASGTLRVYHESTARLLGTTRIPAGSYNVQFAAGRVLTPSLDEGTLCVLDANGRLSKRVHVAPSSHDACLASS